MIALPRSADLGQGAPHFLIRNRDQRDVAELGRIAEASAAGRNC
jgi:hypothetical protein